MTLSALLISSATGWVDVYIGPVPFHSRREAHLALASTPSWEARRLGGTYLLAHYQPRVSVRADWHPALEERPYRAFHVGDTITEPGIDGIPTRQRVVSLTVAEDANGRVSYAPELADRRLTYRERLERIIRSTAEGTLRGGAGLARGT